MKAELWPNHLGWTIATKHGEAYVYDCVSHLRVFLPMAPRDEWIRTPLRGDPRWITIGQARILHVPMGTDPLAAVKLCGERGKTIDV